MKINEVINLVEISDKLRGHDFDSLSVKQSQSGKWRIYTGSVSKSGQYIIIGPVFSSENEASTWLQKQKLGIARRNFFGKLGFAGAVAAGLIALRQTDDAPATEKKQTAVAVAAPSQPQDKPKLTLKQAVYAMSATSYDIAKQGISRKSAMEGVRMAYTMGPTRDLAMQIQDEAYAAVSRGYSVKVFQETMWGLVKLEYQNQTGKQLESFAGTASPFANSSKVKNKARRKVEDLAEGPIWDKTKNVVAGAAIAGAALAGGNAMGQTTTTSFNASAGTPQFAQMEDLANKYYTQMLEKAKTNGVDITVNMVRRWKQDAQYKAIRDLSS